MIRRHDEASLFAALGAAALVAASCANPGEDVPQVLPPSGDDWMFVATVGGAAVDHEDDDTELEALLDALVAQNVTVVEADSSLSEYLSDQLFEQELELMRRVAGMAHARGLRVVWYYPSLEVITVGGEHSAHSMFKDHPDWVQRSGDGTPNVFYGSKVFWVEEGDESAWMSHLSPYREVYLRRVEQIAATGVDGLWLDVPLFNDVVGRWASHTDWDKAKFLADTGYEIPVPDAFGALDPYDRATRVWLRWRHQELADLLIDVWRRSRAVSPAFNLIVETVTMDYNAAVFEGLDGAFHLPQARSNAQGVLEPVLHEGFWHVWEVDVMSDHNAMQRARWDDWASIVAMYEFGRGADMVRYGATGHNRPAWAFTYGYEWDDAEAVMAVAVAAQVNPYELKSPEMTTTVDPAYRAKMFGFVRAHDDLFFHSRSAARVAVIHSSASRDYLDGRCSLTGECGVALYATTSPPPDEAGIPWWTNGEGDSVKATDYLAEYRGMVKALVELHVPFDVLPSRLFDRAEWTAFGTASGEEGTWQELAAELSGRYEVVVAPSLLAVSDGEAAGLRDLMDAGVKLVFVGELPGQLPPGTLDGWGLQRTVSAFTGAVAEKGQGGVCVPELAGGFSYLCAAPVGRTVLLTEVEDTRDRVEQIAKLAADLPELLLDASPVRASETSAVPRKVYVQAYDYPGTGPATARVIHAVNLTHCGDGRFTVGATVPFELEIDHPFAGPVQVVRTTPRGGDQAAAVCSQGAGGGCRAVDGNTVAVTVDFNQEEPIHMAIILTEVP